MYTRPVANAALQPVIARAGSALERGQAATTIELLAPLLRTPSSLTKEDELSVRVMLAESYLLQGDLAQAGTVLGRIHVPPLRQRREEVPYLATLFHLATLFLRDASDRLGKPDMQLASYAPGSGGVRNTK